MAKAVLAGWIFLLFEPIVYNFIFLGIYTPGFLQYFIKIPIIWLKQSWPGGFFIFFQLVSNPKKINKGPPPGGYSITLKCRPLCHANVLVHNSCFCTAWVKLKNSAIQKKTQNFFAQHLGNFLNFKYPCDFPTLRYFSVFSPPL